MQHTPYSSCFISLLFLTNQTLSSSSSMASICMMTSSFLGGSTTAAMITKQLPTTTTSRYGPLAIRASNTIKVEEKQQESINGTNRRGLVFGSVAAGAAAFSLVKIAMAADDDYTPEPKRGTPEAKKKYAPVCVSNPTARICRG